MIKRTSNLIKITTWMIAAMLFFCTEVLFAQRTVTIGTGTSTNRAIPTCPYWRYGTMQTIYTQNNLGEAGRITSIAFNVATAKSLSGVSIKIYMANTYKSAISPSSYVPSNELTLVYSSSNRTIASTTGWETYTLDTPFEYNGVNNLVVVVAKQSSSYIDAEYYVTTDSSQKTIERRSDSDASSYAEITGTASYEQFNAIPNTRFTIVPKGELKYAYHTTDMSATVISGQGLYGAVTIPSSVSYNGSWYTVKAIGEEAFKDNKEITSVSLPSAMTYISGYAFQGCTNLETVNLSSELQSIGVYAFYGCSKLKNITLPYGLSMFGTYAFAYCSSLTSLTIPGTCTTFGTHGLYACSSLETLVLQEGCTEVGNSGVRSCGKLSTVSLPSTIKNIGKNAFRDSKITKFTILSENTPTYGEDVFRNTSMSGAKLILADNSVANFNSYYPWYSFSYVPVNSLTIENTTVGIGKNVTLTPNILPKACTYRITSWTSSNTSVATISSTGVVSGIKTGTTTITARMAGANADGTDKVATCTVTVQPIAATSLTLANRNISLNCSGSISATILPSNCTYQITKWESSDPSIATVSENGIVTGKSIGMTEIKATMAGALANGRDLVATCAVNVTLGTWHIGKCGPKLTYTLYTDSTLVIRGTGYMYNFECEDDTNDDEEMAPWHNYDEEIAHVIIEPGVTSIGREAFCGLGGLYDISIPSSVATIGTGAFCGASNVTEVIIPNGVKEINSNAFTHCALKKISIPASTTSISNDAFYSKSNLDSIIVDSNNPKYDSRNNCQALIESSSNRLILGSNNSFIPKDITSINNYAFSNYTFSSIKSLASTPPAISTWTFSNNLKTVYVPKGSKQAYESNALWNKYEIIEGAGSVDITDGEIISNDSDEDYLELTYSRIFNNNNWQALYVPFEIPFDTLNAYGLEIAKLNDTHMYDNDDDGVFESASMEFLRMTSGSTEANYPYLIRAKETGVISFTLHDGVLFSAENTSYECSTFDQIFTVTGTYSGISGTEMFENDYYAMGGGNLGRVTDNTVELRAQRWYMSVSNKDGSQASYFAPQMRISINGTIVNEIETSIDKAIVNDTTRNIYSIEGRYIPDTNNKKGIFIKNGKKYIIK